MEMHRVTLYWSQTILKRQEKPLMFLSVMVLKKVKCCFRDVDFHAFYSSKPRTGAA